MIDEQVVGPLPARPHRLLHAAAVRGLDLSAWKLIKEEMIKSEKERTISFIFISFIYQVSRRNASKQKLDEN